MALWPNGRHMTRSTYKGLGVAPGLDARIKALGDRMNRFVGETFARTASTPDGYGTKGYVPAIRAGSMSARQAVSSGEFTGNALAGGPMTADPTTICTITGDNNNVSLIVSMSGTGAVATLTGDNLELKLTIGLSGTAEWTLTGTSSLSMVVPIEGTGNVVNLSGTSDLRGLLSMAGEWTPFTELSPEGLAAAVWNSLLANYNTDGSAGKALSTAGSGGVDLEALAQAVWTHISRTLTDNPGITTGEIITALNTTTIPVDVQKMNGAELIGDGTEGDDWRGVGVPPTVV